MDVNSFQYPPRPAAGISIFHDGLPKLASVHCYDRGNVATFNLDTYRPKLIKTKTIDKRFMQPPIMQNPWGMAVEQQRLFEDQKRLFINQKSILPNTLFKPRQQRFITQKPRMIPAQFYNNPLPRDMFRPMMNKPYECTDSCCVYTCCNQFITHEVTHRCNGFPPPPSPIDRLSHPSVNFNTHFPPHYQHNPYPHSHQTMNNSHPINPYLPVPAEINKCDAGTIQCYQYDCRVQNTPLTKYPQISNVASINRTDMTPNKVVDLIEISDDEKENNKTNQINNIDIENNGEVGQQNEPMVDVETIEVGFNAFSNPDSVQRHANCIQKIIVEKPVRVGEIDYPVLPIKTVPCSPKNANGHNNDGDTNDTKAERTIGENIKSDDLVNGQIVKTVIRIDQIKGEEYTTDENYIQNDNVYRNITMNDLSSSNDCELDIDESSFECFINNTNNEDEEDENKLDSRKRKCSSPILPRCDEEEANMRSTSISVDLFTCSNDEDFTRSVKENKYIRVHEG